jgi:Outer membrane protein beta-barrel domain
MPYGTLIENNNPKTRIMKTKLLTIALLLFIGSSAFSQSFSIGIKGGANLGRIDGQAFKDEFALGYHLGGFATIALGKKFAIQPEVVFNQVNTDTSTKFSDVYQFNHINNIQLHYLSIPLLLNYNVAKFIAIQVGPQFGVLLDQNKDLLQNGGDAFKSGDFSLVGGVQLKLLKFRIYGRYVGGLTDLKNIQAADTWKASAIQLGVGIAL